MKKIEIGQFLDFQYVSAPAFSPDGRYAAFVVQRADLEENRYRGDAHLLEVESRAVRQLTAGGDARGSVWTKEGTILFSALRDPKLKQKAEDGEELSCWYEIAPEGGEARLAFTLPVRAGKLEPVDADRFVVTASITGPSS